MIALGVAGCDAQKAGQGLALIAFTIPAVWAALWIRRRIYHYYQYRRVGRAQYAVQMALYLAPLAALIAGVSLLRQGLGCTAGPLGDQRAATRGLSASGDSDTDPPLTRHDAGEPRARWLIDDPRAPVSVRAQPRAGAPVVATLANGAAILPYERSGTWLRILSPVDGWIPTASMQDLEQPGVSRAADVAPEVRDAWWCLCAVEGDEAGSEIDVTSCRRTAEQCSRLQDRASEGERIHLVEGCTSLAGETPEAATGATGWQASAFPGGWQLRGRCALPAALDDDGL